MRITFGRVRRKTSLARKYVRDCYSLKCPHIFGLYDSYQLSVISIRIHRILVESFAVRNWLFSPVGFICLGVSSACL